MSSGRMQPLEIPPGVVAMPTTRMRSTNWSAVNAIRWIEGQMQPLGGQEKLAYTFASRCRAIHGWYDLQGNYLTAYVCEQHVYVDKQGALINITPTGGLQPPPVPVGGYGQGDYSLGLYGQHPRVNVGSSASLAILPPVYSVDNFGALLMVMLSSDGRLLWWDPAAAAGTLLTQVPATGGGGTGMSPTGRCFVITPARFVMIFGAMTQDNQGSTRRFCWCDQGDPTNWQFTSLTAQAGFLDVEPASAIITAHAGRSGWVVFFTGKQAYVCKFLGLPYVYDYEPLADDVTPWSPQSITTTSQAIMWQSQQGTWVFDGTSINPVPCQIRTWINDDFDPVQVRFQSACAHLGAFNEFWWMYPQNGQPYNTRIAVYNYREGWWSQLQNCPRSAGITSSYNAPALFADGTQPFRHEGVNSIYYSDCDLPWAETFSLNLASGGRLTTLKQMLIDLDGDPANLSCQLFYRMNRLGNVAGGAVAPELTSTPINIRTDGYVDFRTTARDMRLRWSVKGPAVPQFTLGAHLIDVAQRGER
jgi:hypothetical protein